VRLSSGKVTVVVGEGGPRRDPTRARMKRGLYTVVVLLPLALHAAGFWRFTQAVAAAVDESYIQTQELAPYEIYEPRPRN